MWQAHWQETEMFRHGHELKPDVARYKQFTEIGFYQLYTARENGVLVGNAGMYVTVSMHECTKQAIEDTWFLLPEYRKGRNALRFLEYVETSLKEQGVKDVYMTTKHTNGAGRILEFCGYKSVATQFWKEL